MGYEKVAILSEKDIKSINYEREGYEKVEIMSERGMRK